jgi:hypothetical protein
LVFWGKNDTMYFLSTCKCLRFPEPLFGHHHNFLLWSPTAQYSRVSEGNITTAHL